MNDHQKTQINNAFSRMYDLMAGDLVTWYSSTTASGVNLLTIQWQSDSEGIDASRAGIWDKEEYELLFLRSYLESKDVELTPTGYFGIGGARFNFKDDSPIKDTQVPIDGLQNIVTCKVVKAEALENQTTQSGTWTIGGQTWTT